LRTTQFRQQASAHHRLGRRVADHHHVAKPVRIVGYDVVDAGIEHRLLRRLVVDVHGMTAIPASSFGDVERLAG
jgi:hypothetical protein